MVNKEKEFEKKALLNFEELYKDCQKLTPKEFEEKYGISYDMGKTILDKLWLKKLGEFGDEYNVYADLYKKDFSKNVMKVEIFEEGVHNGFEFNSKDIENIVNQTNEMVADQNLQIPIKLGHSNEQAVAKALFGTELKDTKGMPALGWVKNLKKSGKKIVADLVDIPDKLYEMFKEKMYATRSIELWENFKNNKGKDVGAVITGLALLGAETPAVTSLANIFNAESGKVSVFNSIVDKEESKIKEGENTMAEEIKVEPVVEPVVEPKEEPKVEPKVEPVVEPKAEPVGFALKEFKNEGEVASRLIELKKEADEGAKAIKDLAEFKKVSKKTENESYLISMGKEGKLLPFQIEMLKPVVNGLVNDEVEYFDKELEVNKKSKIKDLFKSFINSLPNQVEFKERSMFIAKDEKESLDDVAKRISFDKKISYELAVKEALRVNPKLIETDSVSQKKGA